MHYNSTILQKLASLMLRVLLLSSAVLVFASDACSASGLARVEAGGAGIDSSIVQIYTVSREPYYANPWVTLPEYNVVGSGFIIEGRNILTNAHVVANHTVIEVRRSMESKRYRARLLYAGHDADLALLTVDDESFFAGAVPLDIGRLPGLRQKVLMYGFPDGGRLTITEGILSRIEHKKYTHSSRHLLAGEILSDIRTGHSGGPVVFDNRAVGVMMQANRSGSVAHMVPAPVIEHFLSDVEDGRYDGFPDLGLVTHALDRSDLRCAFSVDDNFTGVMITHVIAGSPAEGMLMEDDILLAVNGYNIDDDGTIAFRPGERTHYKYAIEMNHPGSHTNIKILRSGKVTEVALNLHKTQKDFLLVSGEQYDRQPRYFIFGGIVFSPLTKNFINSCRSVPEALVAELSNWPTRDRQEAVVAVMVLPDEVNRGYQDLSRRTIKKVNGSTFRDFDEFYELVTTYSGPYIVFQDSTGRQVVIDRKQAAASHERILQTYSIREDRSRDLQGLHAGTYPVSGRYQ